MPVSAVSHKLHERERELAVLEDAIETAGLGAGSLVVIEGEAGIGKTALLDASARSAQGAGLRVLRARADALESELSFGVCAQLFSRLAAEAEADGSDVFAGAAAAARTVLEGGASTAGPGENRTVPLINGLYWLCANLAEEGPLLVGVDDAHWIDLPSLQFLGFLARRLDDTPVVLLVATRPVERRSHSGEALAAMRAEPGATVLRPRRLSGDAIHDLIEAELGASEPEFDAACLERSGGNPLYVWELLREAEAERIAPTSGEAVKLADLRPEGVTASVLARLATLGADARALAEVAAVGGGRLALREAATLAGLDSVRAHAAADGLASAALLGPGEPLAFVHPLLQDSVRASMPAAARAGLHARIAEALRARDAGAEVVAAHLLHAERGAGPWVVATLGQAAEAAMARGAPGAAAAYLRRALDEGPSGAERGRVLVALGLAEAEAGEPGSEDRLRTAVELLAGPEERAGVLLGLGMTLSVQGEVARATDAFERGIAVLGAASGPVARDLEILCVIGLVHDLEGRLTALPRIEGLLADPDLDRTAIGRMLLAQAAAERAYQGGSMAELRELAARAVAPGLDEADPAAFWAHVFAAYAYDDIDEYREAEREIARAMAIARRRGSAVQVAAACHPRAFVNGRSGRIAASLADAAASIQGSELGWQMALPSSRAVLAEAHLERGELEAAAEATELPNGDEPWTRLISFGWLLAARARVALERGEAATALDTYEACGALLDRARLTNPSVISWRSGAALAAIRLGRRDRALELAASDVSRADAFGAPRARGIAFRTHGLALGGDEGIERLREAVAVLESSQATLEHARTRVELGAALRRDGRRRDAREPLRRGLEIARECGALAIADRAHTELKATGARPRRYQLSGIDSLTPSERRIAAMAAEGFTNPQIAQALFLTRRTVEMHLTNTYRKLEISSRGELPASLRDQDASSQ